jgi:hypothetical protein
MLLPAVLLLGRNIFTGAAVSSMGSDVHVASWEGEEAVPRKVPMSFKPTSYVRMDSVTWTEWGDEHAEGYARITSDYPSDILIPEGGWIHMRLTCPTVQQDGLTYFGSYEISWISQTPEGGVDGWEDGGRFVLFEETCGDGEN